MANEYNHLDKDSHILNAGIMPPDHDWNSNTSRNSVILTQSNSTTTNKPTTGNNGLGLYISSVGMGSTYDAAADERAFQLYFPDGEESGIHYRVKQGSSGWHDWKMIGHDFAFKNGPNTYTAPYYNTYHNASDIGISFDATSNASRITILEDGYYWCMGWQRGTAGDSYVGLGLDGSRSNLENRANGFWSHDHNAYSNQFRHTSYIGPLSAGEHITCGAPSTASAGYLSYGSYGYNGGYHIIRIQ
jgi:hypothetical protein